MDLQHYLHVVRRNTWIIAVVVLLSITLAVFQNTTQAQVYEARASVLLRPENISVDPASGAAGRFDAFRYGNIQLAVITSAGVIDAAAEKLSGPTAEVLYDNISATMDEEGAILTVAATARNPQTAAARANALVDAYLEQREIAETGAIDQAIIELQAVLDALTERLDELAEPGPETSGLPGVDLTATQQQYATVFGRLQDLTVQRSVQRPTAEVLEPARAPEEPIGLGLPGKIAVAALLGAVLGLGLAFAREELDDRVRNREEVQELTTVPVLAELAFDRRSARSVTHLATNDDPLGSFAEGIRSLRTSISFLSVDRPDPIRRVLVTSTNAGDGKTLVAANLAIAYAQAGYQTILVSADLRRPRVELLFGREVGGTGLADAFSDDSLRRNAARATVSDVLSGAVMTTRVENLWLLPAGASVPNPAELVSSSRMDEVLDALSHRFEMVIVDTSPLLAVTDAAALAPKVGHVLVVASMQGTRRRSLVRAAEMVQATRAEVLGVVLNRMSGQAATYAPVGYANRPLPRLKPLEEVPATRG